MLCERKTVSKTHCFVRVEHEGVRELVGPMLANATCDLFRRILDFHANLSMLNLTDLDRIMHIFCF